MNIRLFIIDVGTFAIVNQLFLFGYVYFTNNKLSIMVIVTAFVCSWKIADTVTEYVRDRADSTKHKD